jgi:copper resistance protein B
VSKRSDSGWVAWLTLNAVLLSSGLAQAQTLDASDSSSASPVGMAIHDQRVYAHALFDELEGRVGDSSVPFRWDGEGWVGTDINRLWVKSEGFAVNGVLEDGDHELLYDRPVSTYFDLQGGMRYDLDSLSRRGWAALGIEGLAPYFFEVSATLYASDAGHFAGKLLASYDELFTQRLILQPLAELNLYSRTDAARDVGAGLSDLDVGLRLRYEITRKFAPYVGVAYQRAYGPAAANDPLDNGRAGAWRLAAGVRAWL